MNSPYIKYLTNLRVLATVLVIMLHVCASYMFTYKQHSWQWESINVLDSATRICIGLFLMITGALLVNKTIVLKKFLKVRFSRILFPFLFWSVIYTILDYCMGTKPITEIIEHSFYFGAYYHFWYVYILIGIYLLIPIISIFLVNADQEHMRYFLVIWAIWLFANMHLFSNILPDINLVYFSGYLGYVVLGYYLHQIYTGKKLYLIATAIIIGYLITVVATSIISSTNNQLETSFYQYLDINVVLMAAGVFLLFKNYITKTNAFIVAIAKYSYGIYFIHPLFIYLFLHYNLTFTNVWFVDVILKTIVIVLASLASIYILNKVPGAKRYVG